MGISRKDIVANKCCGATEWSSRRVQLEIKRSLYEIGNHSTLVLDHNPDGIQWMHHEDSIESTQQELQIFRQSSRFTIKRNLEKIYEAVVSERAMPFISPRAGTRIL